eukprot:TRINITY_DN9257_c0_g1_i1.p1 TRINITY_DN9257_c0_g1~~TRINITY_DN9257_c0_g1_i1.p1  ORF type:complete len:227 (-),score=64.31 TRINITY_DN9257_c0_g1_i1:338-1018(-)
MAVATMSQVDYGALVVESCKALQQEAAQAQEMLQRHEKTLRLHSQRRAELSQWQRDLQRRRENIADRCKKIQLQVADRQNQAQTEGLRRLRLFDSQAPSAAGYPQQTQQLTKQQQLPQQPQPQQLQQQFSQQLPQYLPQQVPQQLPQQLPQQQLVEQQLTHHTMVTMHQLDGESSAEEVEESPADLCDDWYQEQGLFKKADDSPVRLTSTTTNAISQEPAQREIEV